MPCSAASYPNDYVRKVNAVTPKQISDVAARHLQDDRATIVIVGDRKIIEEQVKAFGNISA
jgi:predicted Zn-dependent peptidase